MTPYMSTSPSRWFASKKITLRVSLRAAEMNEIDPIPVTFHDPGQVVITSDTERTCARQSPLLGFGTASINFREIIFRAQDTGKPENGIGGSSGWITSSDRLVRHGSYFP